MKVPRCKGSRDLSPEEMKRFRQVEKAFRSYCLRWGYEEVRTPSLEYLALFTSAGTLTPSRLGKVYSFLDWDGWSGERVVLRPDGTIPIARLYIDSMADRALARLFYVANMFSFESTGEKTRERWQCGAELIGTSSATADVELMALALEVLKRLGLEGIELKLSHAGLINTFLAKAGLNHDTESKIFDRILDGDIDALRRLKLKTPELKSALQYLLELSGKTSGALKNLKSLLTPNLPEIEPSLDDFINITSLLDALEYDYQIDLASGSGFEYYTGVIFRLFAGETMLGGGGRYDALIPLMGGQDTPASGFALYLDRLMNLIAAEPPTQPRQRILVRAEPAVETLKKGFNVARYLRDAGYVAELNLGSEGLASFRWTLDVQSKAPPFILTDLAKHKKFELKTDVEVRELLGRKGADKDSLT